MTVVSEIGDTWSPHTAPESTDATAMIIICMLSAPGNIAIAIGTRMANVPQLVPVENDRKIATRNKIAGSSTLAEALEPTRFSTKEAISRASPIPFSDHAKIRIPIAGIIILKPSTKLSINPLNVITLRGRYSTSINITVISVAKIRLVSASHPAKAVTTSVAPPRNPV